MIDLSPGTTQLTRDEKVLVLSILFAEARAEAKIEAWKLANPGNTITYSSQGRRRVCMVMRDNALLAKCTGVDDDDARGQAFSAVFANEAAELNEG